MVVATTEQSLWLYRFIALSLYRFIAFSGCDDSVQDSREKQTQQKEESEKL